MLKPNSPLNLLFMGSFRKDNCLISCGELLHTPDLQSLGPVNANTCKSVSQMASFDHSSPCYPGKEVLDINRFKEHRPTEARHSAS